MSYQVVYIRGEAGNVAKVTSDGRLQVDSNISGQTIKVDRDSISGARVRVDKDDLSGLHVNAKEYGSSILTATAVSLESLSGGTELGSGAVFKVEVRSFSGNAVMWIGGTGANAPNSGKGFELFGGEAKQIPVDNFNKVRIYPGISGQKVSYMGYA